MRKVLIADGDIAKLEERSNYLAERVAALLPDEYDASELKLTPYLGRFVLADSLGRPLLEVLTDGGEHKRMVWTPYEIFGTGEGTVSEMIKNERAKQLQEKVVEEIPEAVVRAADERERDKQR